MNLLFRIILNVLRLLQGQGRHAQDSVSHQNYPHELQADLRLLQTALKQIHTDREAGHSLKKEELRMERQRLVIERWTLGAIILGLLGAFANLWFLKISIDASRQAANAATDAAQVATDSLVIENRPWLFFQRRNFRLLEHADIGEQFVIENQGKTPALKIDGCVVFEVLEINVMPTFDSRPCHKVEISILRPASDEVQDLRMLKRSRPPGYVIPDKPTSLDVQAGKKYIATHGRFTFKDVFGIKRWVMFCDYLYFGPPPLDGPIQSLRDCAQHNDMDNYARKDQAIDP